MGARFSFPRSFSTGILLLAAFCVNGLHSDVGVVNLLAQEEEARVWTDSTGKFKVDAVLVSSDGSEVTLRKSDNRTVKIPINKLSQADQDYLDQLSGNPFAGGSVESSSSSFSVGGKTQRFDGVDMPVLIGDRSKARRLAGQGDASWKLVPTNLSNQSFSSVRQVEVMADAGLSNPSKSNVETLLTPCSFDSPYFYLSFHDGYGDTRTNFLQRCDVVKGTSETVQCPSGTLEFVSLSPDGKYALAILSCKLSKIGIERKCLLAIFSTESIKAGGKVKPSAIFCPYYTKPKNDYEDPTKPLKGAYWIDDNSVLTRSENELVKWNLKTGVGEYAVSVSARAGVEMSPDRKYIAISERNLLKIIDVANGEYLGVTDLSKSGDESENASQPSIYGNSLGFSPNGERIACLVGDVVSVVDLKTGDCVNRIEIEGGINKSLVWANDSSILVEDALYDLETGLPVCRYANFSISYSPVSYKGLVWTVCSDSYSGPQTLVGINLPHKKALEQLKSLKKDDAFVVYPGMEMSIKTEMNGLLDDSEVQKLLIKQLKERGFKYNPKAKMLLKARCVDTKREEEVTYGAQRGFGRLPLPIPGSVQPMGSVKLKVFEEAVEITDGKQTLWAFARETTGPRNVEYDPEKRIEDLIRETNKPEARFFEFAPLPRYVAKNGNVGGAMRAEITPSGVK